MTLQSPLISLTYRLHKFMNSISYVPETGHELVKCLVEGKKEILFLCNKIYNEDEWPEEFTDIVLLPIPKKNKAKKCKEFRNISLISHTAKTILRIVNRRLRSKMEEELEEEQFGFRKGKGTRHARIDSNSRRKI